MIFTPKRSLRAAFFVACGIAALLIPACGGGGGGAQGAGRGLVLLSFEQSSVDNVSLNTRLELTFSEAVDPDTVGGATIQVREGDEFGQSVAGVFITQGAKVIFEPVLASLCDHSDSGFKPDTQYRVQIIGFPEEFSVRNMSGQPLNATQTYEFHTRLDTDPQRYTDPIPGVAPAVVSTSPANGEQAVAVEPGNKIEIVLSENVDPCTINSQSVLVYMYESGATGVMTPVPGSSPVRYSGFDAGGSTADQTPGDPYTWGADSYTSYAADPLKVLCNVSLVQDFSSTRIVVTPLFGYNPNPALNGSLFPDNALLVVELTFDISDYGGLPLTPTTFAFTTENKAAQTSSYTIYNDGETTYEVGQTTAAVDPDPRAPSRIQGYMLFSGDGDNGFNLLSPSLPQTPASGCTDDRQDNDGIVDNFDPGSDVLLDTGSTLNTCANSTDGSDAVVWEFNSFRIRSGVTVRVIGVNPAIILVQGDVVIENGARLLVYGDGQGGAPDGRGQNGQDRYSQNRDADGGTPVAGGGKGGTSTTVSSQQSTFSYGEDGYAGLGSPDFDPTMSPTGTGMGGEGGGGAGAPMKGSGGSSPWDGSSGAGGGGGHATPGVAGQSKTGTTYPLAMPVRSFGGSVYGEDDNKLELPEAGSGGGSAGAATLFGYSTYSSYGASGGGGGAGGGFVDLTASGQMVILGGIYANGGAGGNGDGWSAYGASAGGGGGSGGAVRLLTPSEIIVGATTVVSTAGGPGGTGYNPYSVASNRNDGGAGGTGRIAMEDGDSVIAGLGTASFTPSEGSPGFYRGPFDAGRFQGGGLNPKAVTGLIAMGTYAGLNPVFLEPVQSYGGQEDFKAGIPAVSSPGAGNTAIRIEVRGYQMNPDTTPDMASETPWFIVGEFKDSGVDTQPTWSSGGGFGALNGYAGGGYEYVQLRISIWLAPGVGPFDPGAYLDDWTIRFQHDL